jgi:hypothetical protein
MVFVDSFDNMREWYYGNTNYGNPQDILAVGNSAGIAIALVQSSGLIYLAGKILFVLGAFSRSFASTPFSFRAFSTVVYNTEDPDGVNGNTDVSITWEIGTPANVLYLSDDPNEGNRYPNLRYAWSGSQDGFVVEVKPRDKVCLTHTTATLTRLRFFQGILSGSFPEIPTTVLFEETSNVNNKFCVLVPTL